ncbi:MAG: hypothetical protein HC817_02350 [Saprospiraceae bacterium]|nr:hypothetical protein [Saprospiraceae bacterium]
MAQVVCPPDVAYSCKDVTGKLDPVLTGMPLFDADGDLTTTYDRVPLKQASCQIDASWKDDTLRVCAGTYKIARTWSVFDWCAVNNLQTPQDERRLTCTQLISVEDRTPPSVSARFTQYYLQNNELAPKDTTVAFDGFFIQNIGQNAGVEAIAIPLGLPNSCGGRFRFTLTADDWSCSMKAVRFSVSDSRVKMVGSALFNAQNQTTTATFEGIFPESQDYVFTIDAADECGYAIAKKTFRVRVMDNIKPQTVCISQTTTSLGTTGTARVMASNLNNGSADNCGIETVLVRRMTDCEGSPNTILHLLLIFLAAMRANR